MHIDVYMPLYMWICIHLYVAHIVQHSYPSYRVAASSRIHATILSTCAGGLFRSTCVFGVFGLAKCWPKVVDDVVAAAAAVAAAGAGVVVVVVVIIIIIRIAII